MICVLDSSPNLMFGPRKFRRKQEAFRRLVADLPCESLTRSSHACTQDLRKKRLVAPSSSTDTPNTGRIPVPLAHFLVRIELERASSLGWQVAEFFSPTLKIHIPREVMGP